MVDKEDTQRYMLEKEQRDYIILDDFYTKMDERNQRLSDNNIGGKNWRS
jgi:hypothetical protein